MTVYIVLAGERGEGGSIRGVFADAGHAIEQAPTLARACFGTWHPEPPNQEMNEIAAWRSGCDFIVIEKWQVATVDPEEFGRRDTDKMPVVTPTTDELKRALDDARREGHADLAAVLEKAIAAA